MIFKYIYIIKISQTIKKLLNIKIPNDFQKIIKQTKDRNYIFKKYKKINKL